jgi:hypothetical protein
MSFMRKKKEVKVTCQFWRIGGEEVYPLPFLTHGLEGGEWLAACLGRIYPGKIPSTHHTAGCVGLRAGWKQKVEKEFSASSEDPTPAAQSVASHCTD